MKISCIVVDDEPLALEVLSSFIARIPYLVLEGQYTDPFLPWSILGRRRLIYFLLIFKCPTFRVLSWLKH